MYIAGELLASPSSVLSYIPLQSSSHSVNMNDDNDSLRWQQAIWALATSNLSGGVWRVIKVEGERREHRMHSHPHCCWDSFWFFIVGIWNGDKFLSFTHEVDPSVLVCIMCWTMQQVALTFPHIGHKYCSCPKTIFRIVNHFTYPDSWDMLHSLHYFLHKMLLCIV